MTHPGPSLAQYLFYLEDVLGRGHSECIGELRVSGGGGRTGRPSERGGGGRLPTRTNQSGNWLQQNIPLAILDWCPLISSSSSLCKIPRCTRLLEAGVYVVVHF